jgi:hypothetical protein
MDVLCRRPVAGHLLTVETPRTQRKKKKSEADGKKEEALGRLTSASSHDSR